MSKIDQLTGRTPRQGNTRSHAMNHSKRTWNLNLQTKRMKMADGTTQKVRISTKTIKTLKKQPKVLTKDKK